MYNMVHFLYMPFLSPAERAFLQAVSGLANANPFLPEHTALERAALGRDFARRRSGVEPEGDGPGAAADQHLAHRGEAGTDDGGVAAEAAESGEDSGGGVGVVRRRSAASAVSAVLLADRGGGIFGTIGALAVSIASFSRTGIGSSTWDVAMPGGHEPRHTFACFRQIQSAFESDSARHYRRVASGGPAAGQRVAIHLHARHAAVPADSVCADGRVRDVDYRAFGHGEGIGGAGDCAVAVFAVR